MKHFGFLVKVKHKDGTVRHYARQRLSGTRAEALKVIKGNFEENNVYLPGSTKENWADLVEIVDAGESDEGYENSTQLYDDVCKKGEKLNKKTA